MPNFENKKVAGVRSVEALEAGSTVDSDTMKVAVEQLKNISPELGEIVGGLLSGPLGAAITALSMIVQDTKGKLDKFNAELDERGQQAAQAMNAGLPGLKKVLDADAVSKGEFSANLSHADGNNDPIQTKIDRDKELAQAQLKGQKQIIETLEKRRGALAAQRCQRRPDRGCACRHPGEDR